MSKHLQDRLTLLTEDHASLITGYFSWFPPEISEHTYTNLFCWRRARPVYLVELDATLIFLIREQSGGKQEFFLFGPPVGKHSLARVVTEIEKGAAGAIRIPAAVAGPLTDQGYDVEQDRLSWDYVYRVSDLAGLAGRGYAKKRNQVKKCLQMHNCRYDPITDSLLAECMAMQERWCAVRSCSRDPGLCGEFQAIAEMFHNFSELNLTGGCIRIDGEIQAFAVAESLNPDTAVIHFEKAMPGFKGLGQLINKWFALYALGDFRFVNREQDLGIPGLRQAKKSYLPHHFVEKTTISFSASSTLAGSLVQGCAEEQG